MFIRNTISKVFEKIQYKASEVKIERMEKMNAQAGKVL